MLLLLGLRRLDFRCGFPFADVSIAIGGPGFGFLVALGPVGIFPVVFVDCAGTRL